MTATADRLSRILRLRQMRLDRAAIALARGNARLSQAEDTARQAEATLSRLEAELGPNLQRHLQSSSRLPSAYHRYATFVTAAMADRKDIEDQGVATAQAHQAATAAREEAEAFRAAYSAQRKRSDALTSLTDRLRGAALAKAGPAEDDRALEAHLSSHRNGGR